MSDTVGDHSYDRRRITDDTLSRITALEVGVVDLRGDVRELKVGQDAMVEKLDRIAQRPSWPIVIMLSFLSSALVGVLVAYLTLLGRR